MFQPSRYQEEIWNFIKNGSGNGVVNAVAGSGKTTTIIKGIEKIDKSQSVAMFAFNKSIVEELQNRVTTNANVKTLHSLGMSTLMKTIGKSKVNSKKQMSIAVSLLKKFKVLDKEVGSFLYTVTQMSDMVRYNNILINQEEIRDLGLNYGFLMGEREVKAVMEVIKRSNANIKKEIDFVDMLYQPVILNLTLPKYDFTFIDEAQDLSIIQQQLFRKTLKRNGRFMAVGDPNQAIYGFAGADVNSFNRLADLPNVNQLDLSVCYRCDKSIVNMAKTIVPHIEYHESSGNGIVRNGTCDEIKPGDMVLARDNKTLMKLCLSFFDEGRKASIKGNDFGLELLNMIKLSDHENIVVSSKRLDRVMENHYDRLLTFGVKNPEVTNSYRKVLEKVEILRDIVYPKVKNITEAKTLIGEIFREKEDKNKITLSTIHKAKGLESKRVHIAAPDKIPSRYAKTDWEKLQERNLQYVCYTRAKNELFFLTDTNDLDKNKEKDYE